MEKYLSSELIFLILIAISTIGIVAWLFRPNAKKKYDEYSKIPLKDDKGIKDSENIEK